MPSEPSVKRAIAFFDGQNLFHAAKAAFGFTHPNYDPLALAGHVCSGQGWTLVGTRFYTGVPDAADNPRWSGFWAAKLLSLSRRGIQVFSRPLRYRNKTVTAPDGRTLSVLVGEEKGIDVRIALDVIGCAIAGACDVALIFSQDQDLSEVADEIRAIARQQQRWIKIASAFPVSPTSRNRRGIHKTDWIRIERAEYEACLNPDDHRPGSVSR